MSLKRKRSDDEDETKATFDRKLLVAIDLCVKDHYVLDSH